MNISSKNRLDNSKNRLAHAFSQLEKIIDKKLSKTNNDDILDIINKLKSVTKDKDRIEKNYSDIFEKYNNIKLLNLEIVEEVNQSISQIEDVIKSIKSEDN